MPNKRYKAEQQERAVGTPLIALGSVLLANSDILTLRRHCWQIRCFERRRAVGCARKRAKSEIPD
jgi:hypothetical protein